MYNLDCGIQLFHSAEGLLQMVVLERFPYELVPLSTCAVVLLVSVALLSWMPGVSARLVQIQFYTYLHRPLRGH